MILRRYASLPNWPMATGNLEQMRRGMDRLFESLSESVGSSHAGVYPAVNISEDSTSVIVRAELPGVEIERLEVTMENDTLTIAGRRELPDEDDKVAYHRRERECGTFRRSLSVPVHVDHEKVEARYRDGILTVTLCKAPEARPRIINVQAES